MNEDGVHVALYYSLNPNRHNRHPLEDDVENQEIVNYKNLHPSAKVDQNNSRVRKLLGDYVRSNFNSVILMIEVFSL